MTQLRQFRVPVYIVRNKVDQDVTNNAQDNDATPAETLGQIRRDLLAHGCDPDCTFLISAKRPKSADLEFGELLRAMADDVIQQRSQLPEHVPSPSRADGPGQHGLALEGEAAGGREPLSVEGMGALH